MVLLHKGELYAVVTSGKANCYVKEIFDETFETLCLIWHITF